MIDIFVSKQMTLYYRTVVASTIRQFITSQHAQVLFTESKCDNILAMKKKSIRTRVTDPKPILLVKKMRDTLDENGNPTSFRQIGKLLHRNVSLIHRWYHFPDDRLPRAKKLSTVDA
jgi:hypothetical protein